MKKIILAISLVFCFQNVSADSQDSNGLLVTLKNSSLMKFSQKPLADLWKNIKPVVQGKYKDNVDQYLAKNKNLEIPELSVTNLNKSQSVSSGFRLLIKHPKQTMNIEFISDDNIAAMVNGIPFTHDDLSSFDKIMNKLINEFYAKKGKKVGQANQGALYMWSLFLFGNESLARGDDCITVTGKLCWDLLEGKANSDAVMIVKRLMREKKISLSDIQSYLSQVDASRTECRQKNNSCERLEWQYSVLKSVSDDLAKNRPGNIGGSGPQLSAPKLETEEKSAVSEFWDDNSSWLKPTLIISGIVLATWGLCSKGVIDLFGCAKDKSSSSSTTLSSALPDESTPTSAIYTGTATK
jgi:hypothetical protein